LADAPFKPVPRPTNWHYRADPPGRYWGNYDLYQMRGGLVRLEDDIKGFNACQLYQGDISRFYFFCIAFDQMMKEGVRGDIAELGTYKGNTATMLATMARRMGTTAWILDTFEGFNPDDIKGIDAGHRMEFEDTSLEAVRALVGEDNVRYVKGYFPDSAAQMPDDLSFSLVHIDCDLYAPIAHALNYFYPRLVPGGYLIVHDYASLAWDGAEKAVDEFFADKPEPVIPLTDGCGSVVIRKARSATGSGNWLMHRRCAKFSNQWTSAGQGGLIDILDSGWSGPEPWGVWGVGASHTLNLYMEHPPAGDVAVEIEAAAALAGPRRSQEVAVYAAGQLLAIWKFSLQHNQAKRSVTVPADAVTLGEWGFPLLRLEFRAREVAPITELDPNLTDSRPLGLALFGIRRGALESPQTG
jgi:Macrocin-O-methyltransferase (TylF)